MSFNKYHDYQFFDKKNKEKKKNIMLNFPVRCTGYQLVINNVTNQILALPSANTTQ